ncbi:uncharacterized protein [Miscanthus floridulus]|uniref:uncharacterized protein isoform X3 n=1 Tax=Miscanthus floridulus TaxID=154761 RepID=UPI003457EF27
MSDEEKEREVRFQDYFDEQRRTARERMTVFAERGEAKRKYGHRPDMPPFEIFKFPDLLERAWGWDWLVPCLSSNRWGEYKKYLEVYYENNICNGTNDGEDGNGIAKLACIKMEHELVTMMKCCPKKFSDEISQSHKVTKCANEIGKMKCCEFPAAAIALKAATKGTNFIIDLLRNQGHYKDDNYDEIFFEIVTHRDFSLETMTRISNECSAAEESAMGSNVSNLVFGESNDKNCSENELAQNNNMQETEKTNQQKCSKENCVEGSTLDNIEEPKIEEHVESLIQDNVMNHIKHQSEVDVSKVGGCQDLMGLPAVEGGTSMAPAVQTVPAPAASMAPAVQTVPAPAASMAPVLQAVAASAIVPTTPPLAIIQEAYQAVAGVENRVEAIQHLRLIEKLVCVCIFLALYAIIMK